MEMDMGPMGVPGPGMGPMGAPGLAAPAGLNGGMPSMPAMSMDQLASAAMPPIESMFASEQQALEHGHMAAHDRFQGVNFQQLVEQADVTNHGDGRHIEL